MDRKRKRSEEAITLQDKIDYIERTLSNNPSIEDVEYMYNICKRGGDVCSVCSDALNKDMVTLGCGHSFHGSCILEHFKYKTNCPLCRTEHCLIKNNDKTDNESEADDEESENDDDEDDEDDDENEEIAEIYKERLFALFLKIKEIEDNLPHSEQSARSNNLWKRGDRLSFNLIYNGEENFTEMFINFCSMYNIMIGYNKVSKLWNGYHTTSDTQKFKHFVNFMSDSNIHVYFTTGEAEQSVDLDYELYCAVL